MTVSYVRSCMETDTIPVELEAVFEMIRTGGGGLEEQINKIRNNFEMELALTRNRETAKKAIADLKLALPGFLPSGTFSKRDNASLEEYSAILCADLDGIGEEKVISIKETFKAFPFVRAVAVSPSGDGLKVFFNVVNDPDRHGDSFRSIQQNIRDSFEIEIDEKCKDIARICFLTVDKDLWVRLEGNEPIPPADPLPRGNVV